MVTFAELQPLLLLFGVGLVAGVINVMAGGGSSLTLPTLIFLGLEGSLANGTNRVAIFIQNLVAVASFRQQNVHQFRISFSMALWTLPGGILGAWLAIGISDELFRKILGVVLIGVVVSMLFPPGAKKGRFQQALRNRPWLVYPVMVLIGFYGGFIQVGVGFLIMAALFYLVDSTLLTVNMHKVFIVFLYTLPALAIFILSGNVDWLFGLSLAAGNSTGAYFSARLAVKKGDRVIRLVLFIALTIMAIKLIF